jgi:1-acyl-sn-glycerol-3-phosphate acyltransferase
MRAPATRDPSDRFAMHLGFLLIFVALVLLSPWSLGPRSGLERDVVSPFLRLVWYLDRFYCGLWHRLKVPARDPLPTDGPVLLVANHTCGIDHLVLQAATRRPLGFVIAQEYYDWPVVNWFARAVGCIPVRRDGRDVSAIRAALRALNEGRVIPIFPEGRILPRSGREFLVPLPGAGWIALRTTAPVIPAYISGTPETNHIGKSLWTPSDARVVFGPEVQLDDLKALSHDRDSDSANQASLRLMQAIRALKDSEIASAAGQIGGGTPAQSLLEESGHAP